MAAPGAERVRRGFAAAGAVWCGAAIGLGVFAACLLGIATRPLGFMAAFWPANALLLQGAISLLLVLASSFTPDGFTAMVAYTSPVFWTFFLLTALTLFVFRRRGGEAPAFRVPLYPIVPIAFVLACGYMLYSSINYVRFAVSFGAPVLAGLVIMAAGIPLYFLTRNKT